MKFKLIKNKNILLILFLIFLLIFLYINSILNFKENFQTNSKNYSGQILQGKNFKGKDLSGYNFTNSDLTGADLSGSTLTKTTILAGTNLTDVNLSRAKISNVDFTILSSYDNINLSYAILDKVHLTNIELYRVKSIYNTTFKNSNCINLSLNSHDQTLMKTKTKNDTYAWNTPQYITFDNCDLSKSFFCADFNTVFFKNGTKLNNAVFADCQLTNVSFKGAILTGLSFQNVIFGECLKNNKIPIGEGHYNNSNINFDCINNPKSLQNLNCKTNITQCNETSFVCNNNSSTNYICY